MSYMNLKSGDRVKIANVKRSWWNICGAMDKYLGKIIEIDYAPEAYGNYVCTVYDPEYETSWYFHEEDIVYKIGG